VTSRTVKLLLVLIDTSRSDWPRSSSDLSDVCAVSLEVSYFSNPKSRVGLSNALVGTIYVEVTERKSC
jgi:hypothetical protein